MLICYINMLCFDMIQKDINYIASSAGLVRKEMRKNPSAPFRTVPVQFWNFQFHHICIGKETKLTCPQQSKTMHRDRGDGFVSVDQHETSSLDHQAAWSRFREDSRTVTGAGMTSKPAKRMAMGQY